MSEAPLPQELAELAVSYLEKLLMKPHFSESAPPELSTVEGFDLLCGHIRMINETLSNFSGGNFEHKLQMKGAMAGYIKALQANIRHLAWICRSVAEGDFSLRVDFMGALSEAFNLMTTSLAEKNEEIRQKQEEMVKLTGELRLEIHKKEKMEEALRASEEMYREKALHDPLTGLYNRGYFFEAASRELENIKRRKDSRLCVLMMDIDHFKRFNDTYGHLCGDEVIKIVADCVTRALRKSDIFARYGGEEFSVLLTDTDLETGIAIAERIRVMVASQPNPASNGVADTVTISIGICEVSSADINPLSTGRKILVETINKADTALYTAKHKGRNMVWVYSETSPPFPQENAASCRAPSVKNRT